MSIEPYGKYIVSFDSITVSAVQDVFELVAPSNTLVSIDEIRWMQLASGATNEILAMAMLKVSGAPTSGSGGAAVTPEKLLGKGGAAAGTTGERNNTTQLTGGTTDLDQPYEVNAVQPQWIVKPKIVLSPSEYFVWQLNTTPTTSLTVSAWIQFSEYGG